ncbi:signal peptide peptidase SppA [Sulfurospirillum sp. T05]|uniref:Signal peptide peptidase SppA n=1 Tax=Sulfurospirillum tamanense TaxID=2813362 RepID=A0ABS2WPD4_9BACT|nr:signal peptide peptidase SppA [Sulfurospirillum tamanensis]MBN2963463.1 signal peptide peptidase SppA [Sulfurospirillum tamanensis]
MLSFFKRLFAPFIAIIAFINTYFKAMLFLLFLFLLFGDTAESPTLQPNLVSIDVHGAIEDARPLLEQLQEAKENEAIKGVLLHVNSPGGGLAASVEVMMAVRELQAAKPVVAYAAGSMTSGSYYAAIWANQIVANPGAFIGSIGVLFQAPNIKPLADKLGIHEQVVAAGKYKQMGTFTREWNTQEREALTHLVDGAYTMFVEDVAKARGLKEEEAFAQARVFLAHEALNIGLVDSLGSLQDAKEILIQLSEVSAARWQEPSQWEKALERLRSEVHLGVSTAFYGLKAY